MTCFASSKILDLIFFFFFTFQERLDNLAFASFPEDYLPYAAAPGHPRTAAPPPYLLWGDDRRRRPAKKRKKPKCAGALLCAIALVIFAILVVVAISVYLGGKCTNY